MHRVSFRTETYSSHFHVNWRRVPRTGPAAIRAARIGTKFVKIKRNVPKLHRSVALADGLDRGVCGFGMGDLINLRKARKRAQRRRAEREATSNRLAHGRRKAERALEQSQSDKAERDLDAHRIDNGDAE